MTHSFTPFTVVFCWRHWRFADAAPVADPPKEY
jgi:hypothetical protein